MSLVFLPSLRLQMDVVPSVTAFEREFDAMEITRLGLCKICASNDAWMDLTVQFFY